MRRVSAGEPQIRERLLVHREEADRRTVLRRHVRDRRPVGRGEARDARPVELDEFSDDALFPEHLRDREHDIGRRRARSEPAVEPEADHLRDEHDRRLAEHRGFGLDAADPPAHHPEPVHHRRVGVGAEHRVGVGDLHAVLSRLEDDGGEVLEVHLMHDAGVRRDDAEVPERLLAPAEEGVALAVARELELDVGREGRRRAVRVDLHRMVDDEIGGLERVDARRIAAQPLHRLAHRRKVDDGRDAREVLEQHARRHEGNLALGPRLRVPGEQRLDVGAGDSPAVLTPQQVLEQHLQGERQVRGPRAEGAQPVDDEAAAVDRERVASFEAIRRLRHAPQDIRGAGSVPSRERG